MALKLKSARTLREALKRARGEAEASTPKVISRKYLSPAGKSEVGVSAIRRAVKATKESKSKVSRAL
jgi:hypothetical protein